MFSLIADLCLRLLKVNLSVQSGDFSVYLAIPVMGRNQQIACSASYRVSLSSLLIATM